MGKKNIIKTGSDFSVHLTSHNQIWRIVLGLLGVLAIYGATTLIFIYGLTYLGFNAALVLQGSNPVNLAILLSSFFSIWVGLAIVNKVIHKRPLKALYGPSYAINWRHFKTATALAISVMAVTEILVQIYFTATQSTSYSAKK